MCKLITDQYLIDLGFEKSRVWRAIDENFTLKYTIDGFDGVIEIYAQFCAPGYYTPEEQVQKYSSIEYLTINCQNPYHVYGGDFHIVTVDEELELFILLKAIKAKANFKNVTTI